MFLFDAQHLNCKLLKKLDGDNVKAILRTLGHLCRHDWNAIIQSKIKNYHLVPLPSISEKIRKHHMAAEEKEKGGSNNKIMSFAFSSKGRILGFVHKDIFFITYIDRDHNYVKG